MALKLMADQQLDALVYATFNHQPTVIAADVMTNVRSSDGYALGNNRYLASTLAFPAMTLPAGFTTDGLPVGIEFLGRPFAEGTLIKLGYAFEQCTHHRKPPSTTPPISTGIIGTGVAPGVLEQHQQPSIGSLAIVPARSQRGGDLQCVGDMFATATAAHAAHGLPRVQLVGNRTMMVPKAPKSGLVEVTPPVRRLHTGASSGARAAYWSGLVHRLSSPSRMSDAQPNTLRPATMRRIAACGAGVPPAACRWRAQRVGKGVDVVRVDDECVPQFLRGARKRAQHEDAVLVVARRDELLGDEVHAVVQ